MNKNYLHESDFEKIDDDEPLSWKCLAVIIVCVIAAYWLRGN